MSKLQNLRTPRILRTIHQSYFFQIPCTRWSSSLWASELLHPRPVAPRRVFCQTGPADSQAGFLGAPPPFRSWNGSDNFLGRKRESTEVRRPTVATWTNPIPAYFNAFFTATFETCLDVCNLGQRRSITKTDRGTEPGQMSTKQTSPPWLQFQHEQLCLEWFLQRSDGSKVNSPTH